MALPINQVVVQSAQVLANQFDKNLVEGLEDFESIDFATYFEQAVEGDLSTDLLFGAGLDADSEQILSLIEIANNTANGFAQLTDDGNSVVGFDEIESASQISGELAETELVLDTSSVVPVVNHPSTVEGSVLATTESSTVTQQTVRAVQTEFVSFRHTPLQTLTVEINPPELGRIHIQVELVADQLAAQIVASEYVSAEILSQQKHTLEDTLSEFGFGDAAVSVSHGDWNGEAGSQDREEKNHAEATSESQLETEMLNLNQSLIVTGLNLVA